MPLIDLKATAQYEKQEFETPASNLNLIGSTFSETFHRNLPRRLVFSESVSLLPAWNELHAYSANASEIPAAFRRPGRVVTSPVANSTHRRKRAPP